MKARPVYYTAFGLKDGTVYAAMPVRKPRKTKHGPAPRIDAEGICQFYAGVVEAPADMPEWRRATFHTTVGTALNVRRIIREQVAGRLDALEQAVAETQERLARIEDKLDRLLRAGERPAAT
jgi:hypothetical protein